MSPQSFPIRLVREWVLFVAVAVKAGSDDNLAEDSQHHRVNPLGHDSFVESAADDLEPGQRARQVLEDSHNDMAGVQLHYKN